MRRVLIISPHFPPTDAVDMHRVRTTSGYYRDHGWDPVVLAVEPGAAGRMIDPQLAQTVRPDIPVVRTGAFPEGLARAAGFSAIAFRAYAQLRAAGDRIIRERRPDLAFFSTTAFPVMALGADWKRRFGLPYVLDLQDPWFTTPASTPPPRRGAKARLMYALHRRLERRAMSAADGLIAVSNDYFPPLAEAYPNLRTAPREAIPFGFDAGDFETAARVGRPVDFGFPGQGLSLALYAGRISDDMRPSLRALLAVLRAGRDSGQGAFAGLRLGFVGTGYQSKDNPPLVAPVARDLGLEEVVRDRPDRVSLLDALASLVAADILLLLGSADLAYQPSKLFQYLATDRPILCVAPRDGQFAKVIRDLDSVFLIDTAAEPESVIGPLSAWLERVGAGVNTPSKARRDLAERFSARVLARRECALFDRALGGAA